MSLCRGGSGGPQYKRLQLSPSVETPLLPSTQASGPNAGAVRCREHPAALGPPGRSPPATQGLRAVSFGAFPAEGRGSECSSWLSKAGVPTQGTSRASLAGQPPGTSRVARSRVISHPPSSHGCKAHVTPGVGVGYTGSPAAGVSSGLRMSSRPTASICSARNRDGRREGPPTCSDRLSATQWPATVSPPPRPTDSKPHRVRCGIASQPTTCPHRQ